jgi:hypothetical protein
VRDTATSSRDAEFDQRLEQARALRAPGVDGVTSAVREVVVVVSSSRGGSSMLADLLRSSPGLLHLTAEIGPFLRLAGLGFPDSGTDSDVLGPEHVPEVGTAARACLDDELGREVGQPSARLDVEALAADVAWRTTIQWPTVPIDPAACAGEVVDIVAALRRARGWDEHEVDADAVALEVVRRLRAAGHDVDPWYYDVSSDLAREVADGPPGGPPGRWIVEEPPFVAARRWQLATADDLATKPLVVKMPSNAYRLGFLRALFANARFRVLHLTRNPAASINGLYDGWRHHGFHAHRLDEPLEVDGVRDGDRWWWKFDLPPGWRDHTRGDLLDICAFQWRSAHQAVLAELGEGSTDHRRLRFEDVQDDDRRLDVVEALADWLGVPFTGALRERAVDGVGPLMVTSPPARRRWQAREPAVRAAIDGDVRRVADALGYEDEGGWT